MIVETSVTVKNKTVTRKVFVPDEHEGLIRQYMLMLNTLAVGFGGSVMEEGVSHKV